MIAIASSATRVTACSGISAAKAAGATKNAKPKPIAAWTDDPEDHRGEQEQVERAHATSIALLVAIP